MYEHKGEEAGRDTYGLCKKNPTVKTKGPSPELLLCMARGVVCVLQLLHVTAPSLLSLSCHALLVALVSRCVS